MQNVIPDIKTILYATDLKEKGRRSNAFRMAVSLARAYDARIVIMHAMEPISSHVYGLLNNAVSKEVLDRIQDDGVEKVRETLKARIKEFCDQECPSKDQKYPGGEPIIEVEEGETAEVILELSRKHAVDMIVMGTRTHSAIGQVLLGSTANKVIHNSNVPVTVYPL